jgi:glycosyltransferase involved in cell wall biosynthesis
MVSGRKCFGDVGGSTGVNYKLLLANRECRIIDGMYHLFLDADFSINDILPEKFPLVAHRDKKKRFTTLRGIAGWTRNIYRCKRMLVRMNQKYAFSAEDVFVAQDLEAAYALCSRHKPRKMFFVYHNQGSAYDSWKTLTGGCSAWVRMMFESATEKVIKYAIKAAFPSQGAVASFIETSGEQVRRLLDEKSYRVLHNGCEIPEVQPVQNSELNLRRKLGLREGDLVFITVSRLDKTKNMQAVPPFMKKLQDQMPNKRLFWVLVGDGLYSSDVENAIAESGLKQRTYWIKQPLPHEDIFTLFYQCDFYIIFQTLSVFDYATLESMGCGCVPILSNVGGNKEMVIEDNGVLVEDVNDVSCTTNFISKSNIRVMKDKNIELQKRLWGSEAFLKRYRDFIR